ncbi:MAG TPA: DUF6537 domain-containing protein, partial [Candidatus Dormibacteraeota bacterium]|nr:DUF6537 domain-containing protein [Candidatus Dormibacteraeota bacterium]
FIGVAPFVDAVHFVQNVGDGTFFHSASQSLRACVAAGLDITFKLLYNRHVAMTGGQALTGGSDVVTLTRYLESEGVKRTIVVSENPGAYRGARLAAGCTVYPRERYEDAVRELRAVAGTTVLLFDQECAAEKRRARKRGRLPEPSRYVFINEDVCEGCGDCGDVSNCMSVQPVETEFGRKTQIHQSSCNKDYSCTRGDCPSFLTVYAKGLARREAPRLEAGAVPDPDRLPEVPAGGYCVYMPGIGGTGVVTTNQVLAYAALMEGRAVQVLDQTGLAQKGGAVLSSLVISDGEPDPRRSNKVGAGQADLLLALDALGAVNPVNADRMSPARTVVVADRTVQPTAEAVRHVELLMPGRSAIQRAIDRWSRADENVWVDAGRTVEAIFGDQMMTNAFMLGVAYQAGRLPVRAASIEAAIELNGVAVDRNRQAFRYGRLAQHDPAAVRELGGEPSRTLAQEVERYRSLLGRDASAYDALLARAEGLDERLRRLLAIRLGELVLYQDVGYARRYLDRVLAVRARESQVMAGRDDLTEAAIRQLHRLMAYKDEYEVARLLLRGEWAERLRRTFVEPKVRLNLHPPFLRERGLKRKLELGAWFTPLLRLLPPMRHLRGTRLDPFGRSAVRRLERDLVGWYEDLLDEIIRELTPACYAVAVQLAAAPDRIRGYEQIKVRTAAIAREYVERRRPELRQVEVAS